jgi:hypothetical protein
MERQRERERERKHTHTFTRTRESNQERKQQQTHPAYHVGLASRSAPARPVLVGIDDLDRLTMQHIIDDHVAVLRAHDHQPLVLGEVAAGDGVVRGVELVGRALARGTPHRNASGAWERQAGTGERGAGRNGRSVGWVRFVSGQGAHARCFMSALVGLLPHKALLAHHWRGSAVSVEGLV